MFRNLKPEGQESDSYQYEQDQDCDGDELCARAKVKVVSRELASNVECEDTRLTDAGRKGKGKGGKGDREKGNGGTKGKVDPKERDDPRESGQVQVTRGTVLGIIPSGTARRKVLRWIRGQLT